MKEKILEALKNKYKNLGFDQSALEQVSEFLGQFVTTDEGIEPAVNGAENTLKTFQSLIDKRVTDAVAKVKADVNKNVTAQPTPEPPKNNDDVPAWAKSMMERIEGYEKRENQKRLDAKVHAALSVRKIPESYWKNRNLSVEKEEDIDNVVKQVEADYTAFRQDLVNEGVIIAVPSESGGDKADAALAKQIAEKRNNPISATTGVEAKKLI